MVISIVCDESLSFEQHIITQIIEHLFFHQKGFAKKKEMVGQNSLLTIANYLIGWQRRMRSGKLALNFLQDAFSINDKSVPINLFLQNFVLKPPFVVIGKTFGKSWVPAQY